MSDFKMIRMLTTGGLAIFLCMACARAQARPAAMAELSPRPAVLAAAAEELPPLDAAEDGPASAKKEARQEPAAAPLLDESAVPLRPMFVKGRTCRYSFWSLRQQDTIVQMGDKRQEANTGMTFEGESTWSVLSVRADGSATCMMSNDFVVAILTLPDGSQQTIDSRKNQSDNPTMLQFLKAICGVPIWVEMGADGSAISVTGGQVIAQRLGKELAAMAPADEEHVETATELATLPFAPPQLAVGQSWTASYDWKHEIGRIQRQTQYTLAQVEQIAGIPVATINVAAQPRLVPDYSKFPADGPKVNIRQTQGTLQGQILYDLQRHEVVGMNFVRNLGMEIQITLPNNQTLTRVVQERVQSQQLRISESQ